MPVKVGAVCSDIGIFLFLVSHLLGKGGKSKRKGKNKNDDGEKRELVLKEDEQEYAQVTKILGNCRVEAYCFDGQTRLCHVRGKFRKKVWINRDDIILVGLRDYQDDKADVIHKYTTDEARQLKTYGELPEKGLLIFRLVVSVVIIMLLDRVLIIAARINQEVDLEDDEQDDFIDFNDTAVANNDKLVSVDEL